jgi:1,4-dihydroxy-2-naphthoate octaprenyltransferase
VTASQRIQTADEPSLLKKWYVAIRPFSLPASAVPVIFGTVTAVTAGNASFRPLLFLLSLAAMMAIHGGANIINDIVDYRKGLDTVVTPVSGAMVRGWFSLRTSLIGAAAFFIFGSLLGLVIALHTGPYILYLGVAGVAIGIFYTLAPIGLKYRGLGDLAVFLDFGTFGALGAWTVQSYTPSWTPVIWSIPISLLVVAIVHANNWRDSRTDGAGGFRTVAQCLGDSGSLCYYGFLIFSPFFLITAFIILSGLKWTSHSMPYESLMTLCATPMAVSLWKKALRRHNPDKPLDFVTLDGATAQYSMVFGLLYSLSFIVHAALIHFTAQ